MRSSCRLTCGDDGICEKTFPHGQVRKQGPLRVAMRVALVLSIAPQNLACLLEMKEVKTSIEKKIYARLAKVRSCLVGPKASHLFVSFQ